MNKKIILLWVINFVFVFPTVAQYELVWSDEFDYEGSPDNEKWNYDLGDGCPNVCGWGNNELEYYTDRIENVFVADGHMTIRAIKENDEGKNYTSTRIISKGKGDWLYGRIEVKAKLPSGKGTWPAIWMLPTDWEYGGWPDSGEIDIMEHVGYEPTKIYGTVHTKAYNHSIGTQKGGETTIADAESEFHVYSIEWSSERIYFFVDEKRYFVFEKEKGSDKWPFDKRFHLIMNIAVGGEWGGAEGVDEDIFPQEMVVDYVRVYKSTVLGTGALQPEVEAYPNPNDSNFKIHLPKNSIHSRLLLTSMTGRVMEMESKQVSENEIMINAHQAQSGMYLLTCHMGDQLIDTQRIMIRR